MNVRYGARAYARVGIESGVMSANPHKLIVMLFDGAAGFIRAARLHMQAGQVAAKGEAISKAIDVVGGLSSALDHERGGELAGRLESLYDYISDLLLKANLENSVARLDEAERLLADIASAWREIGEAAAEPVDG
ncbi:flagellar export chaperone FliS [Thauera chlorobenzoica]|uniref:Flagellar secretion chaperone FliS n=1 Tax=Thauera chlorobenzoica TaxID=96773 RepID=A0A1H5VZX3_9RHOO|nr:flagellar export chaperone FliS [Thauera chlorobenzoica]APR03289.1 Flagellar biosynthesis protein FliS [Thauera chlorobenzoica]SEF92421.1 flagellar protein FliS [Thauera chlorobenzoica]